MTVKNHELRELFETCGEIAVAIVVKRAGSDESRGYGYVYFIEKVRFI